MDYMSAPVLNWHAIISTKKVEVELISDIYMYLLFEKGLTGRVLYILKRYSKANNKCLKSHGPKQISKSKNNLYVFLCPNFFQ